MGRKKRGGKCLKAVSIIVGLLIALGVTSSASAYDYTGVCRLWADFSSPLLENPDQIKLQVNESDYLAVFSPWDESVASDFLNVFIVQSCGVDVYDNVAVIMYGSNTDVSETVDLVFSFTTTRTYGRMFFEGGDYELLAAVTNVYDIEDLSGDVAHHGFITYEPPAGSHCCSDIGGMGSCQSLQGECEHAYHLYCVQYLPNGCYRDCAAICGCVDTDVWPEVGCSGPGCGRCMWNNCTEYQCNY